MKCTDCGCKCTRTRGTAVFFNWLSHGWIVTCWPKSLECYSSKLKRQKDLVGKTSKFRKRIIPKGPFDLQAADNNIHIHIPNTSYTQRVALESKRTVCVCQWLNQILPSLAARPVSWQCPGQGDLLAFHYKMLVTLFNTRVHSIVHCSCLHSPEC